MVFAISIHPLTRSLPKSNSFFFFEFAQSSLCAQGIELGYSTQGTRTSNSTVFSLVCEKNLLESCNKIAKFCSVLFIFFLIVETHPPAYAHIFLLYTINDGEKCKQHQLWPQCQRQCHQQQHRQQCSTTGQPGQKWQRTSAQLVGQ